MSRPATDSVYGLFRQTAAHWPDRDLFMVTPGTADAYGTKPCTISYADAHQNIESLSDRFSKAGYKAGMRVALLLENRPQFFLIWLALNKLHCSVVPINPDLRTAELKYLIGHAEPVLIIAIRSRVEQLVEAADAAETAAAVITPEQRIPRPRESTVEAQPVPVRLRESALLYTSGTTGQPKGCMLSNNYFLLAGVWYAEQSGLISLRDDGERMITPLPVFHMNAMAYSFMAMLAVGGCLIALDRFHPDSWWSEVAETRATCLHYLGVMPSLLMNAAPADIELHHAVRFGFGAGVDPTLHADFEKRFGFPLIEAWAMTETGAGAVVAANSAERLVGQSCLGKPTDDIDYQLVDDAGQAVDDSEQGELWVRRRGNDPRFGFFSGYYKDEEATALAWQHGWFHTGDIVAKDGLGNLHFVDRKKNVIRRSGENIAAVEVESVLMKHPCIATAGVTAIPDSLRGDEVFACIQTVVGQCVGAEQIMVYCLEQMAYYKAPGYIAFVDKLPLTATQKIQRAALKNLALQLLEDNATHNMTHMKKRSHS